MAQGLDVSLNLHYAGCSLRLSGTHCADCARQIEKVLTSMPGVPRASVNVAAGLVSVEFVQEQTSPERIVAKIYELGYKVDDPDRPRHLLGREVLEPVFVGINLVTLIAGFVLRQLGAPAWLVSSLAVAAYVAGAAQ